MKKSNEAVGFGVVLQTLRKRHGLSRKKLSEMVRCPVSRISNIERGKKVPTLDDVRIFSEAFRTDPVFIMFTSGVLGGLIQAVGGIVGDTLSGTSAPLKPELRQAARKTVRSMLHTALSR